MNFCKIMKSIIQPYQLNPISMASILKVPAYEFTNTFKKTTKESG